MATGFKGGKLILVNMAYVLVGFIVLRIADPFKWFVPGPDEVAKKFLKELEYGNWDKAKKYVTEESKSEIDQFASMIDYSEFNYVYILDDSREGDHAVVRYELGYDGSIFELNLDRIDKEWKADVTARDLMARYEDEATYDDGDYEWETVNGTVGGSDQTTTLSDEEAKKIIDEFLKELEKQSNSYK